MFNNLKALLHVTISITLPQTFRNIQTEFEGHILLIWGIWLLSQSRMINNTLDISPQLLWQNTFIAYKCRSSCVVGDPHYSLRPRLSWTMCVFIYNHYKNIVRLTCYGVEHSSLKNELPLIGHFTCHHE